MVSIQQLKKENKRLLAEKKRLMNIRKQIMAERVKKEEFRKLKNEVKRLKSMTSPSLYHRAKRYYKDPDTQSKIKKVKKYSKLTWNAIQNFADKYGEK